MDNPEKLATQCTQEEENENKKTIKYVLDTKLFLSSSAKHLLKTGKIPTHIRFIINGLNIYMQTWKQRGS